jgi:SPOR domain
LKKLTVGLLLLLTGCSGSAADRTGAAASAAPSLGGEPLLPSMALRLPARGGAVTAYLLPALAPVEWISSGTATAARSAVAMDGAGNRLLYRDRRGAITEFDLVASHERAITPAGQWLIALSTDTLFAVSARGEVIESEPWGSHPWPNRVAPGVLAVYPAIGSRLILIHRDSVSIDGREPGASLAVPAPTSGVRAASLNGDAVAFATDSGVVVLEERDQWRPWYVALTGSPDDVVFTPSGHQLYVTLRTKSELAVLDRFLRRERPSIPLPSPAAALRMDPWGRAVLVRPLQPAHGGETWVVGIASRRLLGTVDTPWDTDLPGISQDGALLLREGDAVVARDIHSLDSLGAVAGGASDLWFVGRWKPVSPGAAARFEARRGDSIASARPAPQVAPPPAARRAPPSPARAAAPTPAPAAAPPGPAIPSQWIQLAVFQNEVHAHDMAADLTREGHRPIIAQPAAPGEGWRVLLGPFPNRVAADSAARLLGRPYFITGRGPTGSGQP